MSHPNIPAIYDVEFLDEEMRIYFEYIDGKNVRHAINEKRIPIVEHTRQWFIQIPHPGDYQNLSDSNEARPPSVDELIKKCLVQDRTHRIPSAESFADELRASIRTDVPLSSLLTDARLHEILAALAQLSPEDFHAKPRGQRLLIINRLKDLVRSDRQQLRTATGDLIVHLLRLATLEPSSDYTPVVEFAFLWGFDKIFTETWQGNEDIRNMLVETAKSANADAHHVISTVYLRHVNEKTLTDLPGGWYHHDLRRIIVALLANPNCGEIAVDLATFYDKLNLETHLPVT